MKTLDMAISKRIKNKYLHIGAQGSYISAGLSYSGIFSNHHPSVHSTHGTWILVSVRIVTYGLNCVSSPGSQNEFVPDSQHQLVH